MLRENRNVREENEFAGLAIVILSGTLLTNISFGWPLSDVMDWCIGEAASAEHTYEYHPLPKDTWPSCGIHPRIGRRGLCEYTADKDALRSECGDVPSSHVKCAFWQW